MKDFGKTEAITYWHEHSLDQVKNVLIEAKDFDSFSAACNAISNMNEHVYETLTFHTVKELRDLANESARNVTGKEFADLFDRLVKASKEELWGGDEFYKLFDYAIKPYYVRSCAKGSIWLINRLRSPISTIDDALSIAIMVSHPPYWDIVMNEFSRDSSGTIEEEIDAWKTVARYLFDREYIKAYEYIDSEMKKSGNKWE